MNKITRVLLLAFLFSLLSLPLAVLANKQEEFDKILKASELVIVL